MNTALSARRRSAELRAEELREVAHVGNRPLPHFWPMLASYFRDVLLPPQRRAEETGLSWTWHAPAESPPISAGELAALRKRLTRDLQLLADTLAGGASGGRGIDVDGLGATMDEVVTALVARSDTQLAGYVCRTENGLRLHSWGASRPALVSDAEQRAREICGVVRMGGKPARRGEVWLETEAGERRALVRILRGGVFCFSGVAAGVYRMRARVGRIVFPPEGLAVAAGKTALAEVRLECDQVEPGPLHGWTRVASATTILLVLGLLGVVARAGYRRWSAPDGEETVLRAKPITSTTETGTTAVLPRGGPPTSSAAATRPVQPRSRAEVTAMTSAEASSSNAAQSNSSARPAPDREAFDERPRVPGSPSGRSEPNGLPMSSPAALRESEGLPDFRGKESSASLAAKDPSSIAFDSRVTNLPASRDEGREVAGGVTRHQTTFAPSERGADESSDDTKAVRPAALLPVPEPPRSHTLPTAVALDGRSSVREASDALPCVSFLRVAPWKLQFLADAILPTVPVRAGGLQPATQIHTEWLNAQQAALPAVLREARVGVRVVLMASNGASPLRGQWRRTTSPSATIAEVTAIDLNDITRAPSESIAWSDEHGRILCDLSRGAEGDWRVRASEALRVVLQFAIAIPPAEAERFGWRGISGETLPQGLICRYDPAVGEHRAAVAIGREASSGAIVFSDRDTGWALTGALVLRVGRTGE